ncbi:TolC family protein [Undibacterium sp.]|uniref:TolC family protein n=1 Tax=Undibacterium sp. TaxID=1914977 RepID=UPI00374DA714
MERTKMTTKLAGAALLCFITAGCAGYQPKSLPTAASLREAIPRLTVDASSLHFPEYTSHVFDPSDGLDMVELSMLAVVNNPDLKAARNDAGIAHAQAFSAGLLPDQQLALSHDLSNTGGPGATKAFSYGFSFDFGTLLTRPATSAAANFEAKKTDLNLLWQEWQVISQAQLLYVRLVQGQKAMAVLQQSRALFSDRLRRTQAALDKGLLVSDAVTPNLAALQDIQKQINDLQRQANQNDHDLHVLLGLQPGVEVKLQSGPMPHELDETGVLAALSGLRQRRPDLMALEAGYNAQDQRYRAALLAQFPSLNIGLTRARDSSDVYSNALGVTLSLPIFNRNRGNIAIEQATRQKLYDDYQQRLNIAGSDVHKILADQRINAGQLANIQTGMASLSQAMQRSEVAYRSSNIDALAYVNAAGALLAKQIEEINLQQSILEQRVALQTLLGGELPVLNSDQSQHP